MKVAARSARRRARRGGRARAGRRRDERVPRHPGVHPRRRARGSSCPAHGTATYLLTCPGGRSVVGGLDAHVTSRDVRVGFDGRLGAPVQPGSTTTRYAFFRAVSSRRSACRRSSRCSAACRAGRRRALDGVGARHAARPVARVPLAHRPWSARPVGFAQGLVRPAASARRLVARDRVPHEEPAEARATRAACTRPRSSSASRSSSPRPRATGSRSTRTRSSRSARSARRELLVAAGSCSRCCIVPLALAFALWLDRRRARYAVAFTNLDLLASVVGHAPALVARAACRSRCFLLALVRRVGGARAAAGDRLRAPTGRPSCCSSTSPARCARATSSRPGSTRRSTRWPTFADTRAEEREGRARLVQHRARPARDPDDRPRRAARGHRPALARGRDRDRRRRSQLAVQTVARPRSATRRATRTGRSPARSSCSPTARRRAATLSPLEGAALARNGGHPRLHRSRSAPTTARSIPARSASASATAGRLRRPGPALPGAARPRDARRDRRARPAARPTARRPPRGCRQIYKQLGASIAHKRATREISSWFAGGAALLLLLSLGAARLTGERLP